MLREQQKTNRALHSNALFQEFRSEGKQFKKFGKGYAPISAPGGNEGSVALIDDFQVRGNWETGVRLAVSWSFDPGNSVLSIRFHLKLRCLISLSFILPCTMLPSCIWAKLFLKSCPSGSSCPSLPYAFRPKGLRACFHSSSQRQSGTRSPCRGSGPHSGSHTFQWGPPKM